MSLRSQAWFSGTSLYTFMHRSWMKSEGVPNDVFDGRPVIGICNSWSELTSCNLHLRAVADSVKKGIWEAGGFPLEFPTISLGEPFMKPTAMMFRNLMAMDVEESIKANPVDGVVLLAGCDKTTPAQLMGAASANIPALMVPGGPMMSGHFRGETIGSGTDAFRYADQHRAGLISDEEFLELESAMSRSAGHCMVMGTASTMTSLAEALGMTLPDSANVPAADSRRYRVAQESGRRIVELAKEGLRPSDVMTKDAFENAIRVLMAIGGSTNAVIHLTAMAGRLGIELPLELFDRIAATTPCIVNLKPSGKHLMEDFYYAGGVRAVMNRIAPLLHTDALTVTGLPLREVIAGAEVFDDDVILPLDRPLIEEGGIAVLRGSLAPGGAVIKQSAASPELLEHRGRALVFETRDELLATIDDPELDVDASTVLVLKNAGPVGGPGMPEWGQLPIPRKLLLEGVTDMVRISDARMSGTSFGTVILHVTPESAIGGPLGLVRTGDEIVLDVPARRIDLMVDDAELARRRAEWEPPAPLYSRGYGRLFGENVTQADRGCDFGFLIGGVPEGEDIARAYASKGHT